MTKRVITMVSKWLKNIFAFVRCSETERAKTKKKNWKTSMKNRHRTRLLISKGAWTLIDESLFLRIASNAIGTSGGAPLSELIQFTTFYMELIGWMPRIMLRAFSTHHACHIPITVWRSQHLGLHFSGGYMVKLNDETTCALREEIDSRLLRGLWENWQH